VELIARVIELWPKIERYPWLVSAFFVALGIMSLYILGVLLRNHSGKPDNRFLRGHMPDSGTRTKTKKG
jgi:hypothetical protein